ncbi:MAG: Hpt domain-containing protein [Lachnospiraceae bacterium]
MTNETESLLQQAGIDTKEALNRFLGNETLYLKFLLKFPQDKSYASLMEVMCISDSSDRAEREAFSLAHTLKGVAGNLSLVRLYQALGPYVEALRMGNVEAAKERQAPVEEAYEIVIEVIERLRIMG